MTQLRHKFNAKQTIIDGKKFSSKKEAAFYEGLMYDKKAGDVLFFLRQVPFELPGGSVYRLDFMVFYSNGTVELIEVKGMMTPMAKMKIAQVEEIYGVTIRIV